MQACRSTLERPAKAVASAEVYAMGGALEVSRERNERGWPCTCGFRDRFAINTGSVEKKISIGTSSAQTCGPAGFRARSDSKAIHRIMVSVRSANALFTSGSCYHRPPTVSITERPYYVEEPSLSRETGYGGKEVLSPYGTSAPLTPADVPGAMRNAHVTHRLPGRASDEHTEVIIPHGRVIG
jgi:hypothetical protein